MDTDTAMDMATTHTQVLDLTKHIDFFNPIKEIDKPVHIIGCGAVGSTLIEMCTRMGFQKLIIYDFDTVSAHNLTNQMFFGQHVGMLKTKAITQIAKNINPNIDIKCFDKGWTPGTRLSGYVFLCVDNIDLRRQIVEENKNNPYVNFIADFRMGLLNAQHYAADTSDHKSVEKLLGTMQFTHEEAKEATPVNACGTSLNVIQTVRTLVSLGLANFINFIKESENFKEMILMDTGSIFVETI